MLTFCGEVRKGVCRYNHYTEKKELRIRNHYFNYEQFCRIKGCSIKAECWGYKRVGKQQIINYVIVYFRKVIKIIIKPVFFFVYLSRRLVALLSLHSKILISKSRYRGVMSKLVMRRNVVGLFGGQFKRLTVYHLKITFTKYIFS